MTQLIALRTCLQTSLVVTRCGTRHVKRIGRVSLGTVEGLHEALVVGPLSILYLFDPSKQGRDTSGELVGVHHRTRRAISPLTSPLRSSKMPHETKRQVDEEQGNQTASAAGGASGTDSLLSHDVTGRQRPP
jgi:hypothetical protein